MYVGQETYGYPRISPKKGNEVEFQGVRASEAGIGSIFAGMWKVSTRLYQGDYDCHVYN